MGDVRAEFKTPLRGEARARKAVIRIGTVSALEGGGHSQAFWLRLPEAKSLLAQLATAIRKAEAAAISWLPPEPPAAGAAALPAA